ncbi:hypothetical protein CcaverHIS002_0503950 [Cutaneotrichosporon cavernicola]|uniref:Nonmuscle myosin heavy chain b n=1 Tax=Cutaneotrichosporon cavernicola TaxID=279322 RepID=A0AA48QX26_9TREE|nr:uncharacterized protein CcaverHIS019_0504500 [Cutaneotrichosporon cavernicola]BEI84994.1 hypothetical protein CcaverHIS002_0503950 [Cutaneotrichosporon cavernicola]BEI92822.1 hypothetical protein CcaverHIS019_0504500 [Cutaneotrichosporon cavernicola]BEJ00598.1 hypothetical protein CcaverHIS631_0504550 [Cutaneotrichosporon cavernicola]BEJ08366.1 hypothetical protein CcaverHIS641_0504510 [Cutaneotrichosporon cavernicola]
MDPAKLFGKASKEAAVDAAAQAEFSEKKRVWIPDATEGFLPGWIKSEPSSTSSGTDDTAEVVVAATGETRTVPVHTLSPMNPPQFDGVEDIAELTHLNEASVVNDLRLRYGAGSIYTYSGLFLISLNPYRPLPIYTPKIIAQYRTKRREENAPHIFAIAERAWQQIGEERESQSILITGESGAGKTENTKKVIQYLAAIASSNDTTSSASSAPLAGLPRSSSFKGKDVAELELASLSSRHGDLGLLEQQILQANPILEAFGNAQTMRNNNSSRFGKFIRIFFSPSGAIAGANIDWYLLEKSRVTARAEGERSFHVFYQLLKGAKQSGLSDKLLLEDGPDKYHFLSQSLLQIDGVDDLAEWKLLKDALDIVGFTGAEQFEMFRVVAVILHIGNLILTGSSADQAFLPPDLQPVAERVCHLLGVPVKDFMRSVLTPKVRAGREWVTHARSKKQAEDELAALSKFMYEKTFGGMVDRINKALDRPSTKSLSIGVLDIAGFEIFDVNSYEQLLINYTNEKLQQFFNFHMFTLEQEEYSREGIKWNYVNFGLDLQPTIELIESSQPIGILSMLDEECIMPKATDVSFTEKVAGLWELPKGAGAGASASKSSHLGTSKFHSLRFGKGFVVKHYAGDVEYSTKDWLQKNKDPINDAVARLLSQSEVPAIKSMFSEYAEDATSNVGGKRIKRGAFRTVGQRHKEQLGQLMKQLASTQPHFVRCIVPNTAKKPGKVDVNIVLDQLRCNGVIEGIRIARLGYPNRLPFAEFRQRYEVLVPGVVPQGYMDGRKAAELIAIALELDSEFYAVGTTKIFFKAGILAELEERRDNLLTDIFRRFQAAARMHIHRRRINKLINRAQAVRTIQRNARAYIELRDWPWWSLYTKVRPLLAATRTDDELAKKRAELTMAKERAERDEAEKLRLEELRTSLLAEKEKVEKDLTSERSLALEKEQMLERSKVHEAELNDRVAELETEMEKLNIARDDATATNEKQAVNLADAQLQNTQLHKKIELLEKLSTEQKARETDVMGKLSKEIESTTKIENEKNDLARQLEDLRRDVAKRDDASRRAKEKVDGHATELQKLLSEEKKKSEGLAAQIVALNRDAKRRDDELRDVQEMSKAHESTISAKQLAITDLAHKHAASVKAHEASEAVNTRLKSEIENLKVTISSRDKEKQTEGAERTKLLKSLDELRTVMETKTSEGIKLREAEKSRQVEIAGLRTEATQHQKSLEDFKRITREAASKLKLEVDALRQRHSAAEKELKSTTERLRSKTSDFEKLEAAAANANKSHKGVQAELESTRTLLKSTEKELRTSQIMGEDLQRALREKDDKFADLEDALLPLEHERDILRKRLEEANTQLASEITKRQGFQRQIHSMEEQVIAHRNDLNELERDLTDAAGNIQQRDSEIALLRSRENKTIVEHVHVLESAKKVTDRQLKEQVNENKRLNQILKSLETHRNRLQADLDDAQMEVESLKKTKNKAIRQARASLGMEDKGSAALLEEERRARAQAEARAAALERDLADAKRRTSVAALSPKRTVSGSGDIKLQRALDEISRLQKENTRLSESRHAKRGSRDELLRGLQQSSEALGRDMSDQLRRLDAANRRVGSNSVDVEKKRLELELAGVRQQLDDEREEKDFLLAKLTGDSKGKKPPYEQAMYSHFRLKAKALRSQLDHWLAMEDLNANNGKLTPHSTGGSSSLPFTEDVVRLKELLSQLDHETSPFTRR